MIISISDYLEARTTYEFHLNASCNDNSQLQCASNSFIKIFYAFSYIVCQIKGGNRDKSLTLNSLLQYNIELNGEEYSYDSNWYDNNNHLFYRWNIKWYIIRIIKLSLEIILTVGSIALFSHDTCQTNVLYEFNILDDDTEFHWFRYENAHAYVINNFKGDISDLELNQLCIRTVLYKQKIH